MKQGKAKIPSTDQLHNLLRSVKKAGRYGLRNWTMLHLSYFAGLRAKEIASLTIADVYQEGKPRQRTELKISQTKGNKPRYLSLASNFLQDALVDYYEVHNLSDKVENLPLFTNQSGINFTPNGVVKLFENLYKIHTPSNSGYSSHSGRRYWATKLANTPGINPKKLMSLGGWSSPSMAMEYIDTNEDDLDDLVAKTF